MHRFIDEIKYAKMEMILLKFVCFGLVFWAKGHAVFFLLNIHV